HPIFAIPHPNLKINDRCKKVRSATSNALLYPNKYIRFDTQKFYPPNNRLSKNVFYISARTNCLNVHPQRIGLREQHESVQNQHRIHPLPSLKYSKAIKSIDRFLDA